MFQREAEISPSPTLSTAAGTNRDQDNLAILQTLESIVQDQKEQKEHTANLEKEVVELKAQVGDLTVIKGELEDRVGYLEAITAKIGEISRNYKSSAGIVYRQRFLISVMFECTPSGNNLLLFIGMQSHGHART